MAHPPLTAWGPPGAALTRFLRAPRPEVRRHPQREGCTRGDPQMLLNRELCRTEPDPRDVAFYSS